MCSGPYAARRQTQVCTRREMGDRDWVSRFAARCARWAPTAQEPAVKTQNRLLHPEVTGVCLATAKLTSLVARRDKCREPKTRHWSIALRTMRARGSPPPSPSHPQPPALKELSNYCLVNTPIETSSELAGLWRVKHSCRHNMNVATQCPPLVLCTTLHCTAIHFHQSPVNISCIHQAHPVNPCSSQEKCKDSHPAINQMCHRAVPPGDVACRPLRTKPCGTCSPHMCPTQCPLDE